MPTEAIFTKRANWPLQELKLSLIDMKIFPFWNSGKNKQSLTKEQMLPHNLNNETMADQNTENTTVEPPVKNQPADEGNAPSVTEENLVPVEITEDQDAHSSTNKDGVNDADQEQQDEVSNDQPSEGEDAEWNGEKQDEGDIFENPLGYLQKNESDILPEISTNLLKRWLAMYKVTILNLEKEGYLKDYEVMSIAKLRYERWKKGLINLIANFEDKLHYEFLEVLEKKDYGIIRDRNGSVLVVQLQNGEKDKEIFQAIATKIKEVSDLQELPNSVLRRAGDLDFSISPMAPPSLQGLLKKRASTLFLLLKQLENVRKDVLQLMGKILDRERIIYSELQSLDVDGFLDALSDDDLTSGAKQDEIEKVLSASDAILRENHLLSIEAAKLAETMEKQYFDLLNKTILRVYNGVCQAEEVFPKDIEKADQEEREYLKRWGNIYGELKSVLQRFMGGYLHIKPLGAKRGDRYDDQLHDPIHESEPDENLSNDDLKEVYEDGFKQVENPDNPIIIWPAKVQVVRNKT